MKIISFIEASQDDAIRKILQHCNLWHDPPAPAPPRSSPLSQPVRSIPQPDSVSGIRYQVDPDFLEHSRHEEFEQPWES